MALREDGRLVADSDVGLVSIISGLDRFDEREFWFLAHGGAGPQDPRGDKFAQANEQLSRLIEKVTAVGADGNCSTAEAVALKMAALLEEHPDFNAGRGSSLQADGLARVSASFMESRRRCFSAVMNVQNILHPSELAYHLQFERFSVLDSLGGDHLARELKIPKVELVTEQRRAKWLEFQSRQKSGRHGTIGCVALDKTGNLAAVTSTGGVGNETPGRVGDSPTIAGNFCTQELALSCTGIGEQIISHALAPTIATRFADGKSLNDAISQTLREAKVREFQFAVIGIARREGSDTFEWVAGSVNSTLLWAKSGISN